MMQYLRAALCVLFVFNIFLSVVGADENEWKRVWLEDPGFELSAQKRWWVQQGKVSDKEAHEGAYSLELSPEKANAVSNFPFQASSGYGLKFAMWVKSLNDKTGRLSVLFSVRDSKTQKYIRVEKGGEQDVNPGTDWQELTLTFKAPIYDKTKEYLKVIIKAEQGAFLIDSLVVWTKPDENGIIETAGKTQETNVNTKAEPYTPMQDKKGKWIFPHQEGLPNVLLIGDSISIGYTPLVAQKLAGKANVFRPVWGPNMPANCGDTKLGLKEIKRWLGTRKWDVIHFNWGLHDLCYRHPESKAYGHRDKQRGAVAIMPEEYAANLKKLIVCLQKTGAVLIWANTTVVPPDEVGRIEGDEVKYNKVAEEIIQENNIVIDDLYTVTKFFSGKFSAGKGDVHFTRQGYDKLADQVAGKISELLPQKND